MLLDDQVGGRGLHQVSSIGTPPLYPPPQFNSRSYLGIQDGVETVDVHIFTDQLRGEGGKRTCEYTPDPPSSTREGGKTLSIPPPQVFVTGTPPSALARSLRQSDTGSSEHSWVGCQEEAPQPWPTLGCLVGKEKGVTPAPPSPQPPNLPWPSELRWGTRSGRKWG